MCENLKTKRLLGFIVCISLVTAPLMPTLVGAKTLDYSALGGTVYEAEDAILENTEIVTEFYDEAGTIQGYSGTGFVGQFSNSDNDFSTITFEIEIPEDAKYDLVFLSCSPYEDKKNDVRIDDGDIKYEALVSPKGNEFFKRTVEAELTAGKHTVRVTENWGYFYIDALVVVKQMPKIGALSADAALVNPNATEEAKALMRYLSESYGEVILSGQYSEGIDGPEAQAVYRQTGKYPAILGFDYMYYSSLSKERLTEPQYTTELAIDWWNKGGIVTFCWHWYSPKDIVDAADNPWNKSFYKTATNFDLAAAMNEQDPEGYDLLIKDIDLISAQLKILQENGVPVLWRPLHEASGGWFWWGTAGSENYKALWNLMYDRMVNYHGLNNLIWVWNGQHNDTDPLASWYPGDATVDIIGEDIYADKHDYSSQVERFAIAMQYTSANKILALTETGVIPDPDLLLKDGGLWSWFAPWYREFTVDMNYNDRPYSDEFTELNMLRKVYSHEKVITLDELPQINPKAQKPVMSKDAYIGASAPLLIAAAICAGAFAALSAVLGVLLARKRRRKAPADTVTG